ncbi:M15 family metallopeptidase [Arthrobacter sp. Z1-15]
MHTIKLTAPLLLLTTAAMVTGSGFAAEASHASGDTASSRFTGMEALFGPVTCGLQTGGCFLDDNGSSSMVWGLRSAWGGGEPSPRESPAADEREDLPVHRDLEGPDSTFVVVNKQRPLAPVSYIPGDLVGVDGQLLREAAASSFALLKEAAASEGVELAAVSGYRSYESQAQLYAGYSARYGQATADTISARPGHSEHQTGLAVDIAAPDGTCSLQACFEDTAAGSWAAENAHRFGFIVRYPEDASSITGYAYEPWHLRFVGADLALSMHEHPSGTLEEHLGLPSAEHY